MGHGESARCDDQLLRWGRRRSRTGTRRSPPAEAMLEGFFLDSTPVNSLTTTTQGVKRERGTAHVGLGGESAWFSSLFSSLDAHY